MESHQSSLIGMRLWKRKLLRGLATCSLLWLYDDKDDTFELIGLQCPTHRVKHPNVAKNNIWKQYLDCFDNLGCSLLILYDAVMCLLDNDNSISQRLQVMLIDLYFV